MHLTRVAVLGFAAAAAAAAAAAFVATRGTAAEEDGLPLVSRQESVLVAPRALRRTRLTAGPQQVGALGGPVNELIAACEGSGSASARVHLLRLAAALDGTDSADLMPRPAALRAILGHGGGGANVARTLTGFVFRSHEPGVVRARGAEAHPYQALAALGEGGARADAAVITSTGRHAIRGFVEHALADSVSVAANREWAAMVLLLYARADVCWPNKFGERTSLCGFLSHYARATERFEGSCHGTHIATVLLAADRLDRDHDFFAPGCRELVRRRARRCLDLIRDSQGEDGRWTSNWRDGSSARGLSLLDDIVVTSHLLEALLFVDAEKIPEGVMERGADWLRQRWRHALEIGARGVCPATHALCVLLATGRTDPATRPESPVRVRDKEDPMR